MYPGSRQWTTAFFDFPSAVTTVSAALTRSMVSTFSSPSWKSASPRKLGSETIFFQWVFWIFSVAILVLSFRHRADGGQDQPQHDPALVVTHIGVRLD